VGDLTECIQFGFAFFIQAHGVYERQFTLVSHDDHVSRQTHQWLECY
jgi:hypothetical protein